MLHKRVVVLTVATAQIPHVPEERLSIQPSDTTCSDLRVDNMISVECIEAREGWVRAGRPSVGP